MFSAALNNNFTVQDRCKEPKMKWLESPGYEESENNVCKLSAMSVNEIAIYKTVLLHNGGFCNDCITKQCMHLTVEYTRNASYHALVSQMSHDK